MSTTTQVIPSPKDILNHIENVIAESEQHLVPAMKGLFADRARLELLKMLLRVYTKLLKEARACSNGGWDEIKDRWHEVYSELMLKTQLLRAKCDLTELCAKTDFDPLDLKGHNASLMFLANHGDLQDLRGMLQLKEKVPPVSDDSALLSQAEQRLRRKVQADALADVQHLSEDTFKRRLPRLLSDSRGKWVAFHGTSQVALCDTRREVYEALRRAGSPLNEVVVSRVEPLGPPLDMRKIQRVWHR